LSRTLRCSIKSFIWDLSVLLIYVLMAINFPLRSAFAVYHKLCQVVFSFSIVFRKHLISSLLSSVTHWSLSNVFFNLQLCVYFLLVFLLLGSSFNALWLDRMQGILSILLCWLRLALCPKIWSILEKVPWTAEKNVYVFLLGEMFFRHQIGSFDIWCHLVLGYFCLVLVWMTYVLVREGY
jgi:hypothetical protein